MSQRHCCWVWPGARTPTSSLDYALTDIYLRPKVKLFLQHNPNADPALFRAPMESMDRFTAFVREEFGSARGYLKSLGFSDEDLDQALESPAVSLYTRKESLRRALFFMPVFRRRGFRPPCRPR